MNRPATIVGTPLIASTKMRTGRRNGPPISLRNTAHSRPSGTEIMIASPTCSSVPTMACIDAALVEGSLGPPSDASFVKNAHVSPLMPLINT